MLLLRAENVVSGTSGVSISGSFRWDFGWKGRQTICFVVKLLCVTGPTSSSIATHRRPAKNRKKKIKLNSIYCSVVLAQCAPITISHEPRPTWCSMFIYCKKNINTCCVESVRIVKILSSLIVPRSDRQNRKFVFVDNKVTVHSCVLLFFAWINYAAVVVAVNQERWALLSE